MPPPAQQGWVGSASIARKYYHKYHLLAFDIRMQPHTLVPLSFCKLLEKRLWAELTEIAWYVKALSVCDDIISNYILITKQ